MSEVLLTVRLATVTTVFLLLIGVPLAWWLAQKKTFFRQMISVTVTLPLVLPPTVLGFYLLILLGPRGWVGGLMEEMGFGHLAFTFSGLVIGSVLYSFPLVVQPIQNAFESIDARILEVASTLRATPLDRFFSVEIPMIKSSLLTSAILGFSHTVGEFGVILMIGGNIPDKTRVLSIAIFNHVEAMEYDIANWIAAGMVVFSFLTLLSLQLLKKPFRVRA